MRNALSIGGVRFTPAPDQLRSTGLVGFVRVESSGTLVVDGIQVRRTSDGSTQLSWPGRPNGRRVVAPSGHQIRADRDARTCHPLGNLSKAIKFLHLKEVPCA